jgi:hypothetical protein
VQKKGKLTENGCYPSNFVPEYAGWASFFQKREAVKINAQQGIHTAVKKACAASKVIPPT